MLKKYPPEEQEPLAVGRRIHDLPLTASNGRPLSLHEDRLSGWPKVLYVAATPAAAAAGLARLQAQIEAFAQVETQIVGVTGGTPADNQALEKELHLRFPVLSDPQAVLLGAAGRTKDEGPFAILVDPIHRIEGVVTEKTPDDQVEQALTWARNRAERQAPSVVSAQAPVLLLPDVLDPELCRRVMTFWEDGQKIEGAVASETAGGNVVKRHTKTRTDVAIPEDSGLCKDVLTAIARHLLPEVLKAFSYRASRVETMRIGSYDAAEGGHFSAHRDNTSHLTAYRRYAVSINLNTGDYEGGHLRLPEFGPQLYAPPPGGAAVFSCSLLHLATPVTRGRRLVLLSFLYDEEGEVQRQRLAAERADP